MISRDKFLTEYLGHLNEKQRKAVQTVNGPVLLLAVPGSGKTTVLVNRLGYMLYCEGILPENILTLTYTVAATKDMANRFGSVFGNDYSGALEFRTINGICSKIISRYGQMIGMAPFELVSDEKVTGRILTDILVKNLSEYPTESDVKGARTLITYCKNMLLTDDEINEIGEQECIPLLTVYKQYNSYLRQNHKMDYDDQMVYAYKLLKSSPELLNYYKEKYKYICVDEAQDTSKIQHIIIGLLAGENGNLFMVGDEDQSIYGFRAAYPEALLNFEKEHPGAKVLVMDQNYRSNAKIVSAADVFIQHNKERHEKHMVATRVAESDIDYVELKTRSYQYSYILKLAANCKRETAVLYRDNESAIPLIDQLDRKNIPFRIKSVDMAFFTHRVVTDVTNIMRFALNPYDTDLFMRIYFKCQTYLKKNQAEEICRISSERNIQVLDAINFASNLNGMILKQCRSLQTHLRNMIKESPAKALYRIETPLGYGDYLDRNNIDKNKLFILKMIANNEVSMVSFLSRLEYLQDMLKNRQPDYKCPFILSTIHSSKGLEYDQVYLMDVCDGVFPNNVIRSSNSSTPNERKEFEEERRLFYVGMTRAKNDLHIFTFSDNTSCFVSEIHTPAVTENNLVKKSASKKSANSTVPYGKSREEYVSDFDLIIGERVIQKKSGAGTVTDVIYDTKGNIKYFDVAFDNGEEKTLAFPLAFVVGMRLESGAEVPVSKVAAQNANKSADMKKLIKRTKSKGNGTAGHVKRNSYAYWENEYPDYVVVKKEGAFWTCRGKSAEILNDILGYRLGGSSDKPVTGSPALEPITVGLNRNKVKYIVVEDCEITEQSDY